MTSKHSQVFVTTSVLHIFIAFISFPNIVQADGAVETNWTIVGQSDGSLRINWSQPVIKNSDGAIGPSPIQADQYILNWSFINGASVTVSSNITTAGTNVTINNAYFGATYVLLLYCQMQNVIVTCKNETITAYPSCVPGWRSYETNCYYFGSEPKTWSESKSECELMFSGKKDSPPVSDDQIFQMEQQDTTYWTVMDPCTTLLIGNVSTHNCCTSTTDLSQPFMSCPAEQSWPFICQADVAATMVKILNVSVYSLENNSVVVSWEELVEGWNLLWRTITLYSTQGALLSTITVSDSSRKATLPLVVPGNSYDVKLWPHKDGKLKSDANFSFHFLLPRSNSDSNGGVIKLPLQMDPKVSWEEGKVRIQWSGGQGLNDVYQLSYGVVNQNQSAFVIVNVTNSVQYDVDDIIPGMEYQFNLSCAFGRVGQFIPCGKLSSFNFELPTKIIRDADGYKLYELHEQGVSWDDAERTCMRDNSHLASIRSTSEDKTLKDIINNNIVWIGATNCGKNGGPKWSDGSNWSNISLIENTPSGTSCCVTSNSNVKWVYTNCGTKLSYICQSNVTHIGILQDFTVVLSTFTTFQLQWKTTNRLLSVDGYSAEICDVNATVCTSVALGVQSSPIYIRSLEPNRRYIVRVNATIHQPSYVVSVNATAETGKQFDVTVNVTRGGQISLEWPNVVAEKGKDIVYIISQDESKSTAKFPLKTLTISKNKTVISGLPYGNTYSLNINALENGTNRVVATIPFTLTTKPNCTSEEFQLGSSCYWPGKDDVTWDEGNRVCEERHSEMALTTTAEEIDFLRGVAETLDTSFWVDGKTSELLRQSPDMKILNEPGRVKRSAGCRVISIYDGENDGLSVDQCVKRNPVMCERKLKVELGTLSELIVKDVTSTAITLQWNSTSWKSTDYNVTVTRISAAGDRVKRAAGVSDQPSVAVGNDMATIANLQPSTEYQIDVTPKIVVTGQVPSALLGPTSSINVHTLNPNSTSTPRALAMTAGQLDSSLGYATSNATASDSKAIRNDQLFIFRIISCSCIVGLVTLSLIILIFCGMMKYRDCLCEICFELSLLVAHILILVDIYTVNQMDCRITAICIHYFFTAAFLFFAMECLCYVKTMTKLLPVGFLCHGWQFLIMGWGVPIVIVVITSATIGDQYVIKEIDHYCWVNLNGDVMLATVIPIGVFAGSAFLCLMVAICGRPDENYEVDEESFMRYEPMQDLRWILLFVLGLLVSDWAVGMVSAHEQDGNLYIAFIVLNIILGISILLLRSIGDDEIRQKIRSCCKGSSIEPKRQGRMDEFGRYLSSESLRQGKGVSHTVQDGDGTLIIKRTYIYRP